MPGKKHRTKKKDKGGIKENDNSNHLFNEIDATSIELPDYPLDHGVPQMDGLTNERLRPTGVVGIDESAVLSDTPLTSYHQHDSKSNSIVSSNHAHDKGKVHLPPITHHYPYEYVHTQPNYHHFGHLYPSHHRYQPSSHHKPRETYDSRWWYMPLNSVHGPKLRPPTNNHYKPPKWYELPNRQ